MSQHSRDHGAKLVGVRNVVRRGVRVVEPAHGAVVVRQLLELSYIEDEEATRRVLADAGVNVAGVKLFRNLKVVARQDPEQGGGIVVQPNIPGLNDDSISNYADTEQYFGGPNLEVDNRSYRFQLHSVFSDATLTDKLGLSPKRLQTARRLAACDPVNAAAALTQSLQMNGFPKAVVQAGQYVKSVSRVRAVIREFADTIHYKDSEAPAHVTPTMLHITFDGFDQKPQWTVFGPVKYATEVLAIYQLCIHYGPQHVLFILGVETAMLQINVRDYVTEECYTGQLEGYSSLEGVRPMSSSFPSELTAMQQTRLRIASKKIKPVMVRNAVIGTAVQVSDRYIVLNEHTVNDAVDANEVADLCGQPLHETRSVAHDLVAASRPGGVAQWILRDAHVGERAVLCYSVGDDVEYSEVLQVRAIHNDQVILTESSVLRKGTSGAAVIALRDGALLGLFSTKRGINVVCSVFSSSAFQAVTELESIASANEDKLRTGLDSGDRTYDHMVRRGLQGFLEGISSSSVSLYARGPFGEACVGTAASYGDSWHTTVGPDVGQLTLKGGQPLVFKASGSLTYRCDTVPPLLDGMPNVRKVVPGERVFVFAKSGDEVAMSLSRTVVQRLPDTNTFIVEDFGDSEEVLTGGLIVAERDAAVLGQYAYPDYDVFGQKTVICAEFVQSRSAGGVAPTIADAGKSGIDMPAILTEMHEWGTSGSAAVETLARAGDRLLEVLSDRAAYAANLLTDQGSKLVADRWLSDHKRLMHELGWQPTDWYAFDRMDSGRVATAFLAVFYFRESDSFMRVLTSLMPDLLDGLPGLPVEYAGSLRPPSVGTVVDVLSEERLKRIEAHLSSLSSFVHASSPATPVNASLPDVIGEHV